MSSTFTKTALVTGSAKRLGREIAIELAKDGWNIALHYNTTSPDSVIEEVKKTGVKYTAIKSDLLNFKELQELVAKANKELGEITLLVNSASIFEKANLAQTNEDIYDRHMDLHVKAPLFLSQAFAAQNQSGGQIINIVDSITRRNKTTYFAYLASKKALASLSRMLAAELAPKINVNAVFPGAVADFSNNDAEFLEQRKKSLPQQKFASAGDITSAVIFLANSRLTGQELYIDGGEQLI